MLILSRKTNESIVIDGRITVKIVRVEGDVVKLGVEAPAGACQSCAGSLRRDSAEQSGGVDARTPRAAPPARTETQKDFKRTAGRWNDGLINTEVNNAKPPKVRKVKTSGHHSNITAQVSSNDLQTSQSMLSKSLARLSSGQVTRRMMPPVSRSPPGSTRRSNAPTPPRRT